MIYIHNYKKYSPTLRITSIVILILLVWMLGISMILVLFGLSYGFASDQTSFNHSFLGQISARENYALDDYIAQTCRLKLDNNLQETHNTISSGGYGGDVVAQDSSLEGFSNTISVYQEHFNPQRTNFRFAATDQNGNLLLTNDPEYSSHLTPMVADTTTQSYYLKTDEYTIQQHLSDPASELPVLLNGTFQFNLEIPSDYHYWYFTDEQVDSAYQTSFPAIIMGNEVQTVLLFDTPQESRTFEYTAYFGENCQRTTLRGNIAGLLSDQQNLGEQSIDPESGTIDFQIVTNGSLADFSGSIEDAKDKTAVLVTYYSTVEHAELTLTEYYNLINEHKIVRAQSEGLQQKLDAGLDITVYAQHDVTELITVLCYLPAGLPVRDNIRTDYQVMSSVFTHSEGASASMFLLLVLSVLSAIVMCTAAGHKPYSKEIHVTHLHRLPYEIYCLLPVFALLSSIIVMRILYSISAPYRIVAIFCIGMVLCIAAACVLWLYTTAVRMKSDSLWSSFGISRLIGKFFMLFRHRTVALVLTTVYVTLLGIVNILFLNGNEPDWLLFIIIIVDIATLLALLYCAYAYFELRSHAMAIERGDLEEAVHPLPLALDFGAFDRSLNGIRNGVTAIVDKQLKAEHLRTELITNVSHDLKTPLTSIVNYVDLLSREPMQSESAAEYLDVLRRQAARLKKLTIDLVDASKASTGNLTVELIPTNVQVLIGQITGEYEEVLAQHSLSLVQSIPDDPLTILADGRQIWRVFDNLLNNACKYALGGTRIYLDVAKENDMVEITLKNISATPLNISADELMERFVRGDSSRHTEGSGLGLSIARDLTALQNGLMQLSTDGDLFKVTLTFPLCKSDSAEAAPEQQEQHTEEEPPVT